jgi:predicted ATPase
MKVVLTGGPCVGKSTLIEMLEARGFPVVHEQATAAIKDGIDPCTDHEAFQFNVLNRQLHAEARLSSAPLLFLDRGTFDGIPYREVYGRKVPSFFAALQPGSYDVCFLLDTLEDWENDGVRYESADFSGEIQPYFARVYEDNGIPVIRVPVMPPEARLQFILSHVARAMRKSLTALSFASADAQLADTRNERQKRRCSPITSAGAKRRSVLTLREAIVG